MTLSRFSCLVALICCAAICPVALPAQDGPWRKVDEGLSVAEFLSPVKAALGDSKVTVVRVDPALYAFKLLCASEYDRVRRSARDWCRRYGLAAAVNASMFQEDGIRSVSYMRNFGHVNNPRLSRDNAVIAFNRVDAAVPEVQIIDRQCQDFESLRPKYQTLVQNIRMVDCQQRNVWARQEKKWSMVVFGMDKAGKALLIFTRSPYAVHDFGNALLSLPLSLHNAAYLEGGPEATLFLSVRGTEIEKVGSFETWFNENDANQIVWPLPNVIGVARKVP
jgi:hypothetical protein